MNIKKFLLLVFVFALPVTLVYVLVGVFLGAPVQAISQTKYVAPNFDCGVVAPCYSSIQDAIDASVNGDVVKVRQGVYTGTLSNLVTISKSISILGGFTKNDWGNVDPASHPAILDGEDARRVVFITGLPGYPIPIFAGFTIRNGHAISGGGGGILIASTSVDLNDCDILDNAVGAGTSEAGGGISILSSAVSLNGNTFRNNQAESGGGVSIYSSSVSLSNNSIISNSATYGGGLFVSGNAYLSMSANSIVGNKGLIGGGPGILVDGESVVFGENDIIANNDATDGDGEGVNIWTGSLTAKHWTLANNDAFGFVVSNGSAELVNTIVASHTIAGLFGSVIEADTSLFYANGVDCSSSAQCSNNLYGDPLFKDPDSYNYHISEESGARDYGINAYVYTDIDGDLRPCGDAPDVGADEIPFRSFLSRLSN